jgi:hypothetical protein
MARAHRRSPLTPPLLLGLFLALAVGCSGYKAYDSKLDAEGKALGERTLAFVDKMVEVEGTPSGTYAANQEFYQTTAKELGDLRSRSTQMAGGEPLAEHFRLIAQNLELLRGLHEGRGEQGLSKTVAGPARESLAVQFAALAKLQQERAQAAR